jgi:hypothetical protein
MNRCRFTAALLACALLTVGMQVRAQTEPLQTQADRLRELAASRQAVILPLDGALDPVIAESPEQPEQSPPPEPEAPSVLVVPQSEPGTPPSPPLEGDAPAAEAAQEGLDEPSIADVAAQEPSGDSQVPAGQDDGADAAMLPDLDGIEGLVVAELGNPDSIGPYRLWLASFRTVREAQAGWLQLAKDNRDVLGDLLPVIVMKELGGDSGTFFRLQAGPLADEGQAQARCETLKSRTLYCAILGPDEG